MVHGGVCVGVVVEFVEQSEPNIVVSGRPAAAGRTIGVLAVLSLVIGGVVSWYASAHPDGLEWSIERLTGKTEVAENADSVHNTAARIQEKTAFLPDYSFPAKAETESAGANEGEAWGVPSAGTTVSGLVGGTLTLLLAAFAGWLFRRRERAS